MLLNDLIELNMIKKIDEESYEFADEKAFASLNGKDIMDENGCKVEISEVHLKYAPITEAEPVGGEEPAVPAAGSQENSKALEEIVSKAVDNAVKPILEKLNKKSIGFNMNKIEDTKQYAMPKKQWSGKFFESEEDAIGWGAKNIFSKLQRHEHKNLANLGNKWLKEKGFNNKVSPLVPSATTGSYAVGQDYVGELFQSPDAWQVARRVARNIPMTYTTAKGYWNNLVNFVSVRTQTSPQTDIVMSLATVALTCQEFTGLTVINRSLNMENMGYIVEDACRQLAFSTWKDIDYDMLASGTNENVVGLYSALGSASLVDSGQTTLAASVTRANFRAVEGLALSNPNAAVSNNLCIVCSPKVRSLLLEASGYFATSSINSGTVQYTDPQQRMYAFGYPIVVDLSGALATTNPANSSTTVPVFYFGDFSKVCMLGVFGGGVELAVDESRYFEYNAIGVRSVMNAAISNSGDVGTSALPGAVVGLTCTG